PLALGTYDTRPSGRGGKAPAFARLTLSSMYRALLSRSGHVTQLQLLAGTRDSAFDHAFVGAAQAFGRSGVRAPDTPADASFPGDSLEIRINVVAQEIPPSNMTADREAEGAVPLMVLQLPLRRITRNVRVESSAKPTYPAALVRARIVGNVL